MKARRGIYAAAISPFDGQGRLDAGKLIDYCRHLMSDAGGCDGVAPTGTTGEGTSVAMPERLALPGAFAKAGIPGDRVIFGTGAPSTADAISLTRAALEAGYPNVLVLPPYYYKTPPEEGLYDYFSRLAESVGDFSQSRAFIEATGGVDADFDVFPASEAFLDEGLAIGSAGTISGSTNAFGALAQAAFRARPGAERDAAMAPVKAARAVAAKYNMMAAMKRIEAWRSGDEGWLRMAPPLRPLSEADSAALRADLDALAPGALAAE